MRNTVTRQTGRDRPIALVALLLCVSPLVALGSHGFDFAVINNVFHIPIVLDYAGSAEGPHDVFHATLDRFVSGFWIVLRFLATENTIWSVFFTVHVLTVFALSFILWRIAVDGAGEKSGTLLLAVVPVLFSFPLLSGTSPIGGNEILVSYLTHSQVVIVFVLGSWLLLMRGAPVWSALVMGIAFNINAFAAIWGAVFIGLAALAVGRQQHGTPPLLMLVRMGVAFVLAALPTVGWVVVTFLESPDHAPFSFRDYLLSYYPHHTFIGAHFRESALTFLFFLSGLLLLMPLKGRIDRTASTTLESLLLVGLAIIAFGIALPYVTDSRLLLNLYPLRMDSYVLLCMLIAALIWAGKAFSSGDAAGNAAGNAVDRGAALLALLSFVNGNVALLILAVLMSRADAANNWKIRGFAAFLIVYVGGLTLYFGGPALIETAGEPRLLAFLALQIAVVWVFFSGSQTPSGSGLALIAAAFVPALLDQGTDAVSVIAFYGSLAVAALSGRFYPALLSLLLGGWALFQDQPVPWWALLYLSAGLFLLARAVLARTTLFETPVHLARRAALPGFFIFFLALSAYDFMDRGRLCSWKECDPNLVAAQNWARENTEPNTQFLPVRVDGFSTLSRRPVWIDWKIGAMVMWAPETNDFWQSRFRRLAGLSTVADALALAEQENIDYIVFRKRWLAERDAAVPCVVFENAGYLIARRHCQ